MGFFLQLKGGGTIPDTQNSHVPLVWLGIHSSTLSHISWFCQQRKNSSKYEAHTCCINIYICAYIHTNTHDVAPQSHSAGWDLALGARQVPLWRVQRSENYYREKKNPNLRVLSHLQRRAHQPPVKHPTDQPMQTQFLQENPCPAPEESRAGTAQLALFE